MRKAVLFGFVLVCVTAISFLTVTPAERKRLNPEGTISAASPDETIEFGNTTLWLGMAQQAVINMLAESYTVNKNRDGSDSAWSSWDIQTRGPAPFHRIGNVAFKNGKLASVIKEWGPDDQQKGVELASALYGAIAQFVKEGKHSCSISTGTKQTPQAEFKSAFITCGGKYLQVSISRYEGQDAAYISEFLQGSK